MEMSTSQLQMDQNRLGDQRLLSILESIANMIDRDIMMTSDCPSNNSNGRMPLLDTQVWIEKKDAFPKAQFVFTITESPWPVN